MPESNPAARLVAAIQGAIEQHPLGTTMKLAEPINAGLFDGAGKPMVVTDASFLASSAGALAAVRQFFGNRWRTGDVAITNDADAGAANACEMIVVAPIFAAGTAPAAWALARARVPDFGGWELGGYSPQAVDRWAEGARIEPAKLVVGGAWRREVGDMLRLNSRTPTLTLRIAMILTETARSIAASWHAAQGIERGTIEAEIAAAVASESEKIDRAFKTLSRSKQRIEQPVRVPIPSEPIAPITVAMRYDGVRLHVALSGPAASPLPINLGRYGAQDIVIGAVSAGFAPRRLTTAAILDRVVIEVPEPSLLAAPLPATVGLGRETTGQAVFRGVLAALSANGLYVDADAAWQAYCRTALGGRLDFSTGRLSAEMAAAIRNLEAAEACG
jgi:N-methylhydantoinase B/oxoprolinase/acetone carboxylase alpha subunit